MGVNRNLLGGIALRDAVKKSMPSATDYPDDRYIQFAASAAVSDSITGAAGMVFKPNTQYTFILALYNATSFLANLRVYYTDGTSTNFPNLSGSAIKETIVYVTTAGKTVDRLAKNNNAGSTRVYYDESGIFEGVLTTLDFEPYQAWGITMSGIRRSLVEAALHDDSTVAAPIATFSTDVSAPAKSVLAAFSPIQDLHGYDSPWPAGGGKNLLDPSAIGDETATRKRWYSGTGFLMKANQAYTFSAQNRESGLDIFLYIRSADNTTTYANATNVVTYTPTEDTLVLFEAYRSGSLPNADYQLELGSTATAYAPYSNICPISGRTGLTAYRTGVNVWSEDWESGSFNGNTGAKVPNASWSRSANLIPVCPNTSYYCRFDGVDDSHSYYVFYYDRNGTFLSLAQKSASTSVTTPNDCYFINVQFKYPVADVVSHAVSINCPATDTDYHAYTGASYPVTWQDEAGTVYGGTVDIVSGVLTVDRAAVVYDGSDDETWERHSSGSASAFAMRIGLNHAYVNSNENILSNYLTTISAVATWGNFDNWVSSSGAQVLNTGIKSITDVATWRTYLASNPLEVCYELATPQTYQLTPTQIDLLKGTNNLWQSENGDMTVGYWLHG